MSFTVVLTMKTNADRKKRKKKNMVYFLVLGIYSLAKKEGVATDGKKAIFM